MIILGIEVSSRTLSLALVSHSEKDDIVLAQKEVYMERGQGEALMPFIEEMTKTAQIDIADVNLVCAGVGPGSFTGVRIALSAARGIALALNIPAVGGTGFEIYSYQAKTPICVILDTKRGDYFTQRFDEKGVALEEPVIRTLDELKQLTLHAITGDCLDEISKELSATPVLPPKSLALNLIQVALSRLDKPLGCEPLYLRPADVSC